MNAHHLEILCKQLQLSAMACRVTKACEQATRQQLSHEQLLVELLTAEVETRSQKRLTRLVKEAKFPCVKTLDSFNFNRAPHLPETLIRELAQGKYISNAEPIILIGEPGTGKSHLGMALVREWCLLGRKVRFYTAVGLVQLLLQAKAKLQLGQLIKQLDRFDVLMIDDISYVPFEKSETDVLFTLLSERYEMRSLLITSNLSFSQWDHIFKDSMTTNAAIDRLVHHATILELNTSSYRAACAKRTSPKAATPALKNANKEEVSMT